MTISHGNLRRLAPGKAVTVLSALLVIPTMLAPTTLHARGFKRHHTLHTRLGGSLQGHLAAVLAGEANPNPRSCARVGQSIWNRLGNPRWGGSLQAILSMPAQYVPDWGKAARYPIYRQAAATMLAASPSAVDAGGAASVGRADSFKTGCGGDNCFHSGSHGLRGVRVRYARRLSGGKRPVAVAATPAKPAVVTPVSYNPFGFRLDD